MERYDNVGTIRQVHCSCRRLLRRGLEFHVCTINKSAHTKKVWRLIVCPSYMLYGLYTTNGDLPSLNHSSFASFPVGFLVTSVTLMSLPCRYLRSNLSMSNDNVTTISSMHLPHPSAQAGWDTRSIFKRIWTDLISVCLTIALLFTRERIIGFIPFLRVLELSEMQPGSSRIWTRLTESIFFDDNRYTTATSINFMHTFYFNILTTFNHYLLWSKQEISENKMVRSTAPVGCFSPTD